MPPTPRHTAQATAAARAQRGTSTGAGRRRLVEGAGLRAAASWAMAAKASSMAASASGVGRASPTMARMLRSRLSLVMSVPLIVPRIRKACVAPAQQVGGREAASLSHGGIEGS